jgi:hypothetical protein
VVSLWRRLLQHVLVHHDFEVKQQAAAALAQ